MRHGSILRSGVTGAGSPDSRASGQGRVESHVQGWQLRSVGS